MKISQLPHEIRTKVLEYICEDNLALAPFSWEDTPEGYDYWQEWHEKLTYIKENAKAKAERKEANYKQIHHIIEVVANHFGITTEQLKLERCKPTYVRPRQIAQWLMMEDFTPIDIYSHFGNDEQGYHRNLKAMQKMLDKDEALRKKLLIIMEKL